MIYYAFLSGFAFSGFLQSLLKEDYLTATLGIGFTILWLSEAHTAKLVFEEEIRDER